MKIEELQVRKDDLSATRMAAAEAPSLKDGEVLAKVEAFALTANNITYGVVGEQIGYWKFFPAADGWGIIPAWGFAEIVESRCGGVSAGERLYGYFPMASHLVMTPTKIRPERLIDGAAHRSGLPPVYNTYARVAGEPGYDRAMDDERMLLFPLYATSFCLYDFLLDNDWFGAARVIVASASSKTAIGLAYALHDDADAPSSIGLTSARNKSKVGALRLYDDVAVYDDIASIDAKAPAMIVDMSGDRAMLGTLAAHLGDAMRYCLHVGVTHHEANDGALPVGRERSSFFFAPGHIQKRTADWGPGVFETKALNFWRDAAKRSRGWLSIEKVGGAAAVEDVFHRLREGKISPDCGVVASL
ncbi:MAG: DUF2855 family protein [Pseudomonadota bacterium]|nr:DUF2855 family protein [Pseudomonadota bacterium]